MMDAINRAVARIFVNAGAVLLVLSFILGMRAAASQPVVEQKGKLRIVDLEGTAYERGQTHGRALRPEIRELVERWKAELGRNHPQGADDFIRSFLKFTDFRPAIDRWTPGLLDEVRGIADGVGLDFETMFAYQLLDEFWVMGSDVPRNTCTSIAAGKRNGSPAFVAQTLDIPALHHGFPTLLRIRDKDKKLETLVFTFPGLIAAAGLNSRSVGVCVNAVTQLAFSPTGLPVAFTVRGLLARESYEDAVQFLRDISPAAPQNYVIGGRVEVASFERSAGKMVRFVPFEGATFTYHTNHPMVNDEFKPGFLEDLKRSGQTLDEFRTLRPRLGFLRERLRDNSVKIDVAVLEAIFRDRNSGINNRDTFGCLICILGEKPELRLAPGRPDEEPFQVFAFSDPRLVF